MTEGRPSAVVYVPPPEGGGPRVERPALVITGASGFLGRHLVAALRDRYAIYAVARRSQAAAGVERHPHLTWFQADIGEREHVADVFRWLRRVPGRKTVIHLAAHYDFTGEKHPEYERTNVSGLRNVLEECRALRPERFLFASSVAACDFPPRGGALTEASPPDGDHVYAATKRYGERVLARYADDFPSAIVRLAAMFSDWCEYPPLYVFLGTWLSDAWNRRILGGRGESAIPYLHVRCAVAFFERLLEMQAELRPGEILVASTDGSVSHREAFEAATLAATGARGQPMLMPRPLARAGLVTMDLAGRLLGRRPFERPWMGRYIDLRLAVDGRRTRERTGWSPHPRLDLLRRIPFLVENMQSDPAEWHRRNLRAMKVGEVTPNLRLYHLVEKHEAEMIEAAIARLEAPAGADAFPNYRKLAPDEVLWAKRQLYLQLKNTIRTRDVGIFRAYCRHLAERRRAQGFPAEEVIGIVGSDRDACLAVLRAVPGAETESSLREHVSMSFLVGIDEIAEVYEQAAGRAPPPA